MHMYEQIKEKKENQNAQKSIFILKIYVMKEKVSNFNIKLMDLSKDPQEYIVTLV